MQCAVPQPSMFIGDTCDNFWFLCPLTYMPTYLPDNVPVVTLILAVGLETVEIRFSFDLLNSLWLATQFSVPSLASFVWPPSSVSQAWHHLAGHPVQCPKPGIIWLATQFSVPSLASFGWPPSSVSQAWHHEAVDLIDAGFHFQHARQALCII